jgi:hypothetical protein
MKRVRRRRRRHLTGMRATIWLPVTCTVLRQRYALYLQINSTGKGELLCNLKHQD